MHIITGLIRAVRSHRRFKAALAANIRATDYMTHASDELKRAVQELM